MIKQAVELGAATLKGVVGAAEPEQLAGATDWNCEGHQIVELGLVFVGCLLEKLQGLAHGMATKGVIH